MFQYRQVIHRMRMGESDRAIAKSRLMGRLKCGQVRAIAEKNGWLGAVPLPEDAELAVALEAKQPMNSTHLSLSLPYEPQIQKWTDEGVHWSTIHRTLVDRFGFNGSYSSVRRLAQKLKKQSPDATCILDFAPVRAWGRC
jgi:hypothetical protein